MVETQKFLDQTGVEYLWSKVNTQDYPNNEMLMAVINAIDETKADRSELTQSITSTNATIQEVKDLIGETSVIESISNSAILYNTAQELTEEQKAQARTNIGAASQADLNQLSSENSNYGAENTGKLLYVGADGTATVLALGAGLAIVNGVLTITSTQITAAICGETTICGEIICGGN